MPNSYFIIRSIFFSLALVLLACGQSSTGQEHDESRKISAVAEKDSQLDYNGRAPDHFLYRKPEWPLEIRKEIYGDPGVFSTPRVQFLAKMLGDKLFKREDRNSLWSMKLDGSDKRLVADADLLNLEGGGVLHTPIRSPNNRYVALSLRNHKYDYFIAILDLKTKQKYVISEGGGPPNFNWTKDSKNLIYYANRNHYNYNIPNKKLSNRETIYSSALFLLPGDKKFLGYEGNGFSVYRFDGTRIKQFEYDFDIDTGPQDPAVSPDGSTFFFQNGNQAYVVDIDSGEIKKTFNYMRTSARGRKSLFYPSSTELSVYNCCTLIKINLQDPYKEQKAIDLHENYIWSITEPASRTIFNIN